MKIDIVKKDLPKDSKKIIDEVKKRMGNSSDVIIRTMSLFNKEIVIIFDEPMSDRVIINDFILEFFEEPKTKNPDTDIIKYINQKLPTHKMNTIYSYEELFYNLLSGFTIILVDNATEVLSIETKAKLDSGVLPAQNEMLTKGPKDAFTENYQTNLGLIRKRIKSETLWLEEFELGTRSKGRVGIMYVNDIASKDLVKKIIEKVKNISIDSIFDSNYIVELISENKNSVFANYASSERPDLVCMYLLQGRIAIVVENTPYVVVVPVEFTDFFHTTEDYYQKILNVNYTRLFRYLAFFIAVITPALYIAIATYNIEAIPDQLLMSFVSQRQGVPLPTALETLMMIIVFQIMRETDSRLPSAIGSSLSIVGAIVLGQAAVVAGIVSPVTIIVVSMTAISEMISSNMDTVSGIRWWQIIFLLFASVFGLFGIFMAGFIFLISLTSIKSFGLPFLAPLSPFYPGEQNNAIFLTNKRKFEGRSFLTARKNQHKTNKGDNE